MRKSIKDFINRKLENTKRHIDNGDSNFLISKSKFLISNKLIKYETMVIQKDISEEGWVVKPKIIKGSSYNRKPFIPASIDIFNIIRGLSKKAYILFTYIIENISINSNHIVLSPKDIMLIIDEKYYTNANKVLNELIKNNIIARSEEPFEKDTFVINHNLFFKGNFAKFVYTYNKIYGNDNNINSNKDEFDNREIIDD